jgi:hypothetical protein
MATAMRGLEFAESEVASAREEPREAGVRLRDFIICLNIPCLLKQWLFCGRYLRILGGRA